VHHRRASACEVGFQNIVRIALMQEQRLAAFHRQFQLTFEGTLLRMTRREPRPLQDRAENCRALLRRCDSPRCRWRVSSKARATLANFV